MLNEIVTDSLRYWEKRRLAYNAVLIAVTLAGFLLLSPLSGVEFDLGMLAVLAVFAVIANLLYCAAYPIDLLVQLSEYREQWRRARVLLFGAGTLLAVLFALPVVVLLFCDLPVD
ncbi:MAG: hypothetical protein ACYTHK_01595 [Planctomycetota bacterium]|jgi:hypothetical protein